ncbi:MAG: phage Gp37/Gp68 family protein [Chloroflexi bacterium]|nr:phage Gp37/Gp68 family protein [Chloroflexota bacterium]
MSDKSAIEWTDATWNPITGCSKVSPGCANCYAETLSLRFGWSQLPWHPANAEENVVQHPERLDQPAKWRQPRMIFVNSMSDIAHEQVEDAFVGRIWDQMRAAPQHTFQILTKRPARLADLARRFNDPPLPNVWLGTSVENDRWTRRVDDLRTAPAAARFISAEPLLGPLPSLDLTDIHWLIVGGESGVKHRPLDPDWARDLRDRATAQGVAFFFKQWGGRTPKAGGRELDGRTWDEMPLARLSVEAQEGSRGVLTDLAARSGGTLDIEMAAGLERLEGHGP